MRMWRVCADVTAGARVSVKARAKLASGIAVVAGLAVLVMPQAAYASVALGDGVVLTSSSANDYTFNSTTYYWSVAAVYAANDYDLRLYDGASTLLGSSVYGAAKTDLVAINSNLRPLGSYRASVTLYSGSGTYYVQQRQGHTVTTLPVPANDGVSGAGDPDLAFAVLNSQDVASVADVWLNAGDKFWVKVASPYDKFLFLESNGADSSTYIRSRYQASTIAGTSTAQGCTLYTANYGGWHGFAVIADAAPYPTNPQGGIGFAIHRFDPARPNTCPQRNFPAPTPPGP